MSSPDADRPAVVSSLPASPIQMEVLENLEEHDKIESIVPMKMDNQGDEIYVYDFTLELTSRAYAIRFEEEEWTVIAEDEDVETVGVALQEYHHEQGI